MSEQLPGVSMTAVWLAMVRAGESMRSDRLFDDQLASAFAAAVLPSAGRPAQDADRLAGTREFVAIRTRFYDDYLLEACAAGVRQIVLLAAGLDSRAFRLDWPGGVRLFELDLPEPLRFKEAVLAGQDAVPNCQRIPVAADLRTDWVTPLTAAGFDPTIPKAWLAEGLLPYLTMTDNDRLLATVGELSIPGDHLSFDHIASSGLNQLMATQWVTDTLRKRDIEYRSTLDDPTEWMAGHGWRTTVTPAPTLGLRYGRPLPESGGQTVFHAIIMCTAIR